MPPTFNLEILPHPVAAKTFTLVLLVAVVSSLHLSCYEDSTAVTHRSEIGEIFRQEEVSRDKETQLLLQSIYYSF